MSKNTPLKMRGIEFTEFVAPKDSSISGIFFAFGFSKLKKHANKEIIYYRQNNIHFLLNHEKNGFATDFAKKHGPAICSMGWRVENAEYAFEKAVSRGARPADETAKDLAYPAIYGIGDSLIYFIDQYDDGNSIWNNDFVD